MASSSSSSIIKKLSRNKTLITTLNNHTRILISPTRLPDPPIPIFNNNNIIPKPNPNPNPTKFPVFYPTFAFESFLNPVNQTGYIIEQEENDVVLGEEENVIYADSVKKKRKKKMNKHKLKKLRKRLRRKT